MSILNQILSRTTARLIPVPTPEWPDVDGQLAVRRLTPVERTAFYSLAAAENPEAGCQFQALMACYCTGPAIERLADAADEANVLSDGARESIKKKYAATADCGSNCGSPAA